MINVEVIRFEAQDVITASVAAPAPVVPACAHPNFGVEIANGQANLTCSDCGAKGTSGFPVTTDSITWNK